MQRRIPVLLLLLSAILAGPPAEAKQPSVVRTRHHTAVRVHAGFPLHRALPRVYVRAPRASVRIAPRVFLSPVIFGAVVVATEPERKSVVWRDSEKIERDDDWTELTLSADRRGSALLLDIKGNPASLSFAEVVFENGDAQVVDFDDRPRAVGLYALLDFKDGRKVDHVRLVAKTEADDSEIRVLLVR